MTCVYTPDEYGENCVCVCLVGLVRKKGMLVCASELGDERRVSVDICVGCLNTSIFEVYL